MADVVERLLRDLAPTMREAVCPTELLREAAREIETLRARLSQAGAGGGVAVKPLEWQSTPSRYTWLSPSAAGRYFIEEVHSGFRWNVEGWPGRWTADTLDEAKAAAQADYEARIRSALIGGGL